MDFLSEFFDDIIAKVIPGFAIMYLYSWNDLVCFFDKHKDLLAVLIPLFFMLAWVIGTVVECASFLLLNCLNDCTGKSFTGKPKLSSTEEPRRIRLWLYSTFWKGFEEPKMKDLPSELPRDERRKFEKQVAEIKMFRCLMFISFIHSVCNFNSYPSGVIYLFLSMFSGLLWLHWRARLSHLKLKWHLIEV